MNWYRVKNRLIARFITKLPFLADRFTRAYAPWESEETPWTVFTKPLSECTFALVTTAGIHHRDQPPFDMNDKDGDPTLRVIDLTRPLDSLMITHDYYDHRDADRDINIVFPVERLHEFAAERRIGGLAGTAYSLMGHITGRHIVTLVTRTGPEIAAALKAARVDAVLLTPG